MQSCLKWISLRGQTDWTLFISNTSMQQVKLIESDGGLPLLSYCTIKQLSRGENSPDGCLFVFFLLQKLFFLQAVLVSCHRIHYLQKLWKSVPSSIPRADRTPRGVARHPEAAGSLWGNSSALGRSRRRSRPARTACRTAAAASKTRPWLLGYQIGFLHKDGGTRALKHYNSARM